jgi:Mrp family chromosome partitioning ATPase
MRMTGEMMNIHLPSNQRGWRVQLAEYSKLLLRWGWFVALAIIVITLASSRIPDALSVNSYQAKLIVQVRLPSGLNGTNNTNGATTFYSGLLVSPTTLNLVLLQITKLQQFKDLQLSDLEAAVTATPVLGTDEVLLLATSDTPQDAAILVTNVYQALINEIQHENALMVNSLNNALNTELKLLEADAANSTAELQSLSAAGQGKTFQYLLVSNLHNRQLRRINRINGLLLALARQGVGSNSILALGSNVPLITTVSANQPTQGQRLALSPLVGLIMGLSGAMLASRFSNKLPLRGKKRDKVLPYITAIMQVLPGLNNNRLRLPVLSKISADYLLLLRHLVAQAAEDEKELRFITITSPKGQEGKSTTATGLAIAAAQSGLRTILVDANYQRPVLHAWFSRPNTTGTLDVIRSLAKSIVGPSPVLGTYFTNLSLIPIGNPNQGESPYVLEEPLRVEGLQPLTELLSSQTDLIIFDGPALLGGSSAVNLASLSDIVLLIVDAKKSKSSTVLEAREFLSIMGVPFVTVLNRAERDVVE